MILARNADGLTDLASGLRRGLPGDERRGEQLDQQRMKVEIRIFESGDHPQKFRVILRAAARIRVVTELLGPGDGVKRMADQRLCEVIERRERGLLAEVVERRGGVDLRGVVLRVVRVRKR